MSDHAHLAPCSLTRHVGPFERIPGSEGWLGASAWVNCLACKSTLTEDTAAQLAVHPVAH